MALSPPSSLTATAVSSSQINLSWTNGGSYDVIHIERKLAGGNFFLIDSISGSQISYQDKNLLNGTQYYYRLYAEAGWQVSGYSNTDDDTTDLDAPSNLKLSFVSNQVSVNWTNNGTYDEVHIERKPDGGSYSEIGYKDGVHSSFRDQSIIDGTKYWYKVRAKKLPAGVYSDYSSEQKIIIPLAAPTSLDGECLSPTSIKIYWKDNSSKELGYKIYRYNGVDWVKVHMTAANVQEWTDSGLTSERWYGYKVRAYNDLAESAYSNILNIFTSNPPNAPSNLRAQTISTSQINLDWDDNSNNETGFKIEESSNGVDFSQIDTVGENVTHYERTGLSSDQRRWYQVRAYNVSGNSGYSNIADSTTLAAIAKPSNLVGFAFSGTEIEITFQDNSSAEDDHRVERKPYGGSFSEVKTLPPNVTYWRDSGRSTGTTYIYRVRARQGAQYSDYSDELSIATWSIPPAPSNFSISEITDETMRLSWSPTGGETGCKIEKSTNGVDYSEIAKIGKWIGEYLVRDLDPSTQYWFKIREYNPAGNGTYTSPVTDTTLASYSPSKFDKLIRKKNPNIIYLAEINPLIQLNGFTLVSGKSYTYELIVEERGINIDRVFENGSEYSIKYTINDVESYASTFYFDYDNRKLYIHCSDDGNPSNFLIEGDFWLYITTYQDEAGTITFNGNYYLNLLSKENIPGVTHQINQYFEGTFSVSSGTIAFNNRKFGKEYYFDKRYTRYTWRNRPIILKAGTIGFSYSDYVEIFTALIDNANCNDRLFTCDLIDAREGISRTLPINKLWKTDFPLMDDSLEGTPIPKLWGTKTGGFSYCIDATNKKYIFHDGRVKAVTAVKENGITTLTEDADYYVDLQNGIITFDRDGFTIDEGDYFTVDFQGSVNSADELITNGAEIFKDILNEFLGLEVPELDHDSIYETKYAKTQTLELYLYKETESDEVIRNIEHSLEAYSRQDGKGRIGLQVSQTTVPSSVKYIENHHIFEHEQNKNRESLYKTVNVFYKENPQTEEWSVVTRSTNPIDWKYRIKRPLDIYTYLSTKSDAESLASSIITLFDRDIITDTVAMIVYGNLAGDLIKYSRDRFCSNAGTANELTLRLLSVQKNLSAGTAMITAERVD